ncbi:MAG: RtcB family protein [Clostridia bacterium]|nr:RtcB family protein [Clostridia bacterium]
MIRIQGKHNEALCYTSILEEMAEDQIRQVCDQQAFQDSRIRIMPDVHAGKGCTIGTTMTLKDKVVPGMVGVDIGCGMETVKLQEKEIDFAKLDAVIREHIPAGHCIRGSHHPLCSQIDLNELRCAEFVDMHREYLSLGSLGGGNHFIEVDQDDEGFLYLVVHSGSRHLGTRVATYYQRAGWAQMTWKARSTKDIVAQMKAEGRAREIHDFLNETREDRIPSVPKELAYVEGELFDDYIHDMRITQRFAALNRKAMVDVILEKMGLHVQEQFTTVHNYIDTEHMILRKGSVSAMAGEKLLIPINMRDGSLICVGRGNEEWNYSAPHGAGRLMSRSKAAQTLTMEEYRKEMAGIYTTSVEPSTLDESPMAYKPMEEIVRQIGPTAEIICRIRPVYNFKAGE